MKYFQGVSSGFPSLSGRYGGCPALGSLSSALASHQVKYFTNIKHISEVLLRIFSDWLVWFCVKIFSELYEYPANNLRNILSNTFLYSWLLPNCAQHALLLAKGEKVAPI